MDEVVFFFFLPTKKIGRSILYAKAVVEVLKNSNYLFGIRLFCWNWKLFAESTAAKGKS